MSETWHERKQARSIDYWRHHGIAEETCTACSGSGRYDHHGSPACGSCNGTGRKLGRLNTVEQALSEIEGVARMRRNYIEVRRALRDGRHPDIEVKPVTIPDSRPKKSTR